MNRRLTTRSLGSILLAGILGFGLLATPAASVLSQNPGSKAALTPTFWQRDPDADFEDEGRMHCAPTSVSDGLIYLARALGMTDLVPGTERKRDHIKLIRELAEEFGTDPSIGGTNPDKILTGLRSYTESKGYELSRLELVSWRPVSNSNKKFKTGTKPNLNWMRSAARGRDTVVIFNFGWYYEVENGYERKGGHWVAVVGAGAGNEFIIHNPLLTSEKQAAHKSLELTMLDQDFIVPQGSGEANMKGYYLGDGPGLPHGKSVIPILDAVIVFSLRKQESRLRTH